MFVYTEQAELKYFGSAINYNMALRNKLVGIEIGGTKLQLAVSNVAGTIEKQFRHTINPAAGAEGIQAQLKQSLAAINPDCIAAIGVGFGGPVDWKTGVIQTSHQIQGWAGFNLKAWLEAHAGAPACIDNDANVAALAEATQGGGKKGNPVFYMTMGSGIGGGLVVNGAIYHGATPGEVEIGHLRLSKNGDTLEQACSGWAINKKVRAAITKNPDGLLAQLSVNHTGPEAALLQPALEKGDAAAQEIMASVAVDVAFALSHVVHLFHPEMLIIGGGLSLLGEHLRAPVAQQLPRFIMSAFLPPLVLQLALLQEDVVPAGALELAKQAYNTH